MYDSAEVLQQIDDHRVLVLVLCGGALVCNAMWFVEAFRAGERDRRSSTALGAVLVFLPHDVSYLLRYRRWFDEVDHWFPQLFFVGIVPMVLFELVFLGQILRFGREDLCPWLSERTFRAAVLLAVGTAFAAWELTKAALDDPLYLGSFTVLIFLSPVFGAGLALRRQSTAGQSGRMWWWFLAMASLWAAGSTSGFGADLRGWPWLATHLSSLLWGAALAITFTQSERSRLS